MKKLIIALIVIVLIAVGIILYMQQNQSDMPDTPDNQDTTEQQSTSTDTTVPPAKDTSDDNQSQTEGESVIGTSAGGHDIMAHTFGTGDTHLLFVGGFHGGYEWNTVLVAYELIDYLEENRSALSDNLRVTVIPVLNPDGLNQVVGSTGRFSIADVPSSQSETIPGRFNANGVDLNRNFDCDWQSEGMWQNRTVDGGDAVFSEPESQALRDYVENNDIDGAVVWYSAANGVFASNCHNGVLDETNTMTNVYANASGYPAYEEFNFYKITGDAVNWLAKENIPAISVLLSTHEDVEWEKNRAGIEALFDHYGE